MLLIAQTNFTWFDAVVVLAYLSMLVGIGAHFSRKQKGLESFFLAGRGMSWLPIGLSLMAALNSGIDYIGGPSGVLKYSLIFTVGVFSWVFLYPWVAYVSLPFYRRLQTVSAYEYLERRFNVAVRTLAACIFLLWRVGWMGTALYVPCLAIETITGGALKAIPLIITLGAIVTLYTMLGGIQAVIWTDVIQFCIMLTGVAVAISVILWNVDGGIAAVWRLGMDAGKIDFYYELPIPAGTSLWDKFLLYMGEPKAMSAILITTICGRMAGYTSDQVMVQRFQTTKSLKDSRQAFVINACGDAIWTLGLAFVGLALFAFYQTHQLPPDIAANTDRIFPHFMATVFPTGLIGLVVAAILAASLSSIDSAINSCTSVIVVDFYNRLFLGRQVALPSKPAATLGKHHEAETVAAAPAGAAAPQVLHYATPDADRESRRQLLVSRIATLCFGIVGILIAANVSRIGIVLEIGAKVIQTFTGPILGIYILGMFTRRTTSAGVLAGGLIGTAVALFIAFGQKRVFGSEIITFIWPTVFGLVGTLIGGYVMSMILPGRATEQQKQLTWRNVMRQALPIEDEHGHSAAAAPSPVPARV